jgi:hypothetical protein
MAAPLESVIEPLTCAVAVTWAYAVVWEPRKAKAEASKHAPANVDRDVMDMNYPLKNSKVLPYRRKK